MIAQAMMVHTFAARFDAAALIHSGRTLAAKAQQLLFPLMVWLLERSFAPNASGALGVDSVIYIAQSLNFFGRPNPWRLSGAFFRRCCGRLLRTQAFVF